MAGIVRVVVTNLNSVPLQLYAAISESFTKPLSTSVDMQQSSGTHVLEVLFPLRSSNEYQVRFIQKRSIPNLY